MYVRETLRANFGNTSPFASYMQKRTPRNLPEVRTMPTSLA